MRHNVTVGLSVGTGPPVAPAAVMLAALLVLCDVFVLAMSVAFLAANLFNFAAAHRFVFASSARTPDWRALYLVVLAISAVGLAINDLLLYAATALGLALVPAKIVATLVTLVWNFGARKRLAYY